MRRKFDAKDLLPLQTIKSFFSRRAREKGSGKIHRSQTEVSEEQAIEEATSSSEDEAEADDGLIERNVVDEILHNISMVCIFRDIFCREMDHYNFLKIYK